MKQIQIGIRREDKNKWEKRTPIVPADLTKLLQDKNLSIIIQPSNIRIFKDKEYKENGAIIKEDLSQCKVIFAVKEIPEKMIQESKAYVFFSHTIKGQKKNMGLLKTLINKKTTLIDYERIIDNKNRRLIFFGKYAGLAGMIDALWTFGQRMKAEGVDSEFSVIKQAFEYDDLESALTQISEVGHKIKAKGYQRLSFPERSWSKIQQFPLVIGFAGYGNVSQGAQKVLDCFPHKEIAPDELKALFEQKQVNNKVIYKCVFKEEHMVEDLSQKGNFDLQDYYKHPEKYQSKFNKYLPYLTILMNCIYWDDRYPRLITKKDIKVLYSKNKKALKVIGDISCDIEGAIEFTLKSTYPDNPVFLYDIDKDKIIDGVKGNGPVVLAVDNLPCELSKEASIDFSKVLTKYVDAIAKADYTKDFEKINLPGEIKKAIIVHKGDLTPDYKYLRSKVEGRM